MPDSTTICKNQLWKRLCGWLGFSPRYKFGVEHLINWAVSWHLFYLEGWNWQDQDQTGWGLHTELFWWRAVWFSGYILVSELFGMLYRILLIGFTAAICTYTVQDLHSNAVIGLYVAHKHQCKSSAEMEVYSCKTLLMNLTWEHRVQINTFTTDRSSSIKMLLRFWFWK